MSRARRRWPRHDPSVINGHRITGTLAGFHCGDILEVLAKFRGLMFTCEAWKRPARRIDYAALRARAMQRVTL